MRANGVNNPPSPPSAGGNPPNNAADTEITRHSSSGEDSSDEALYKAIEGIPIVGATLVFIKKKWGAAGLLLFFLGGVFVLGLVFFGLVPQRLVSDKYRSTVSAPSPDLQEGLTLRGPIPLEITGIESGWLQAVVDLYRREGADAQEAESDKRSSVDAVEYTIQDTTRPFAWGLSARSNFQMTAMAFRVTRDKATGEGSIQQLQPAGDTRSLEFSVPACQRGDKLIAVVRVWSEAAPPPEDVRSVLQSVAK